MITTIEDMLRLEEDSIYLYLNGLSYELDLGMIKISEEKTLETL